MPEMRGRGNITIDSDFSNFLIVKGWLLGAHKVELYASKGAVAVESAAGQHALLQPVKDNPESV